MSTVYFQNTNTGSTSFTNTANWSTLASLAAGDNVYLQNSGSTIDSGLLNTVTLGSLTIPMTFTGSLGLAAQQVKSMTAVSTGTTATATCTSHGYATGDVVTISGANESAYNGTFSVTSTGANTFTYTMGSDPADTATGTILVQKNIHLIQPATTVDIGLPGNNSGVTSNGPGRLLLNTGTAQTTVTVHNTSISSTDTTLEPVRLLGSHASNAINMLGGTVGLGTTYPTLTCTFATIKQTGGTLNGGVGLTWSTIYQTSGTMNLTSGAASGTVTQSGGTLNLMGTGSVATITAAGTLNLDMRAASGTTVANLTLNDGAVLDLTGNPAAISVGTITTSGSVTIKTDPANPGHLSWTTLTRAPGSEVSFE